MDRRVTVTVGIPTIPPRGGLLMRALNSVWNQTRQPDEVFVEMDEHWTGPCETRNRILDRVTTDYVAWLDDDDELHPNHLDVLLRTAVSEDADLVYPWFTREDAIDPFETLMRRQLCGAPFDDSLRDYVLTTNNFIPITTLIRTSKLKEVGGFPLRNSDDWPHPANEDWGCWIRLLRAGARFVHAPYRTWHWHRHGIDRRSNRITT